MVEKARPKEMRVKDIKIISANPSTAEAFQIAKDYHKGGLGITMEEAVRRASEDGMNDLRQQLAKKNDVIAELKKTISRVKKDAVLDEQLRDAKEKNGGVWLAMGTMLLVDLVVGLQGIPLAKTLLQSGASALSGWDWALGAFYASAIVIMPYQVYKYTKEKKTLNAKIADLEAKKKDNTA